MTQLRELARPFPPNYIHTNPSGGGQYVAHPVVVQRLLMVVGPYDYEIAEVIRGDVAGIEPNPQGKSRRAKEGRPPLTNAVVGVIGRLTVTIDGHRVVIEDAGDCEDPHNWPHDGARLKDAASDAIKRCAARIGLGLHLWAQEDYFLFERLPDKNAEAEAQREIIEERDGAGTVVRRTYEDTGEEVPLEGQAKLYDDDDPARPFE